MTKKPKTKLPEFVMSRTKDVYVKYLLVMCRIDRRLLISVHKLQGMADTHEYHIRQFSHNARIKIHRNVQHLFKLATSKKHRRDKF